jgi:hypothetical protein
MRIQVTKDEQERAPAAPRLVTTALGALLAGRLRPVSRRVHLPGELGEAVLRLLDAAGEEEVTLELAAWLRQLSEDTGISPELLSATGQIPIAARTAQHTLARVVRDPGDESKPFATLEEWRRLDEHTIGEAFQIYQDLVGELDPLRRALTDSERAEVTAAVAKKDATQLFAFGLRRLVGWLTSTAGLPAG